jgi:hypothetical protein
MRPKPGVTGKIVSTKSLMDKANCEKAPKSNPHTKNTFEELFEDVEVGNLRDRLEFGFQK